MNVLVIMIKFFIDVSRMGRSFGIVLILVNSAWQEKFSVESHVFLSRIAREVWVALMLS